MRALYFIRAAAVFIAATALTACAVSNEDSEESTTPENIGDFTGPWATEFAETYNEAQTDFEREILKDSIITEAEKTEAENIYSDCLLAHDLKPSFSVGGAHSVEDLKSQYSEKRVDEIVYDCGEKTGEQTVLALYHWIQRNPENIDENTLMAECLVRKGAVDKSYTAKDYAEDYENNKYAGGAGAHYDCMLDPLGVLE